MADTELIARLDGMEEIVAQLTMAYSEVWMIVQSLLSTVMVERSEEEQKDFWANLEQVRVEMFKEMRKVSGRTMAEPSPDFARAVENLVTGESSDTEPEQHSSADDDGTSKDI